MTSRSSKRPAFINQPSSKYSGQHSTDVSSSPDTSPSQKTLYKQKSQLCKKFMEKGICPYGHRCKFAHGSHELRQNNGQNCKYKTKQCMVFLNTGYCKYGQRCNFIHESTSKKPEYSLLQGQLFRIVKEYPELIKELYGSKGNSSRVIKNVIAFN